MILNMADEPFTVNAEFSFSNSREAEIAYEVLQMIKEPPRSQVSKSLTLQENSIKTTFSAPKPQQLRTGVNGFLEDLKLVCETMNSFGVV